MNNLSDEPAITRCESRCFTSYIVSPEAMEKIKMLSDEEFEKEISKFDSDMQTFLRIARNKHE